MKLHLANRAVREIESKDEWWAANREAAPSLFARELRDALTRIANKPNSGVGWPTPRRPGLRRILMAETQNHIYFVVDEEAGAINVLAVWSAARKRPPKL